MFESCAFCFLFSGKIDKNDYIIFRAHNADWSNYNAK